jgi:glycogen debranching enzyme
MDKLMEAALELPQHYIEAAGSLVRRQLRSLKHGDAFAVFDDYGDIGVIGTGPEGLYFNDTRYLSWYGLRFEGKRPLLLSVVEDDNVSLSVGLSNPDIYTDDTITLPRGSIAIERTKFLWQAVYYERIGFHSYAESGTRFRIDVGFGADFHDLFEIRGARRERRGTCTSAVNEDRVEYHYKGLDDLKRMTKLVFWPPPSSLQANRAAFSLELAPKARLSLFVAVLCEGKSEPKRASFGHAFRARRRAIWHKAAGIAGVESSNDVFNEVCRRSSSDLYMLMTRTPHGIYPYAGIPWYSTVFGRDGIITAMLLLWLDASVAKGVLGLLAETQAKTADYPRRSRARYCMRPETEKWPISAKYRSGSTMGRSMLPLCLSCWQGCISTVRGISQRSLLYGPTLRRLCSGAIHLAIWMGTALSNTGSRRVLALAIKAGKILMIRSFTPMAH